MKLFVGIDVSSTKNMIALVLIQVIRLSYLKSLLPMTSKVLHSYEKQFLNSMTATTLIKL
ncbi:hypothetical protein EfmAA94_15970 [Enterococcus faecium]|nr:hypothetical protein EfmAA94_15970 [Enterococcus faecium]